ncbi:MAG: hypothetical protein VX278_22425 [Myxococcota bacterium]|nr:hypothetical protein [Myxococcota bacterium]
MIYTLDMATLFPNTLHEDLNPITQIFSQITSTESFNARELLSFLQCRLSSPSILERQTLRLLSNQACIRLDQDRDGSVSRQDLQSYIPKLLSIFLAPPLPSRFPSEPEKGSAFVIKRAALQFQNISHGTDVIDYSLLHSFVLQQLPVLLPCRKIAAKLVTLILLEICIGHPNVSPKDRNISCEQWCNTALALYFEP